MMRRAPFVFIISIIVLELILTIIASESPLKIATGFLLVAFLPGYTFLEVVYRRSRHNLLEYEQIALAIPVSLALDVLLGLLANNIPFIGIQSYLIWMVLLILSMTLMSVVWDSVSVEMRSEQGFMLVGLICLSLVFGSLVTLPTKPVVEPYLSLSIIPSNEGSITIPTTVVVDKPIQINIQIIYRGDTGREILLVTQGEQYEIHLKPDDQKVIPYDLVFKELGYFQSRWDIIDPLVGKSIRSVRLGLRVVKSDVVSTQ